MPVHWDLADPRRHGFSAIETLQYIGMAHKQEAERQQQQRLQQSNQQAARQLGAGDYRGAQQTAIGAGNFDLSKTIGGWDEAQRKRASDEGELLARSARWLRGIPMNQRPQAFAQIKGRLKSAGFGDDELNGVAFDDNSLSGYEAYGTSIKEALASALTEARINDIGADNYRADRNTDDLIGDRAARRGLTARGQDLADARGRRGQDMADARGRHSIGVAHADRIRWQDISSANTRRGQDMSAETARRGQDRRTARRSPRPSYSTDGGRMSVTPGTGRPRQPGTAETPAIVTSAAQAKLLPPGTYFQTPDGRVMRR